MPTESWLDFPVIFDEKLSFHIFKIEKYQKAKRGLDSFFGTFFGTFLSFFCLIRGERAKRASANSRC